MYAVTGATGNVGQALTKLLLANGKQVRALHRDKAKADGLRALGADPVLASVEDASALETAFQSVEAVFVMTPPFYRSHDPRNENALAVAALQHALRAAHVGRVVLLSSVGAELDQGTGAILKLHDLERAMTQLNSSVASIRAAYFMENLKPLVGFAKEHGKLPVTTDQPSEAFDMVATRDIGALAAELMLQGWSGDQIIELAGPRRYSMEDAAGTMSHVVGHPVQVEVVPHAARQGFFEQAGFTAASAATMVAMSDGFNAGRIMFHGKGVVSRQGTTTLDEVLSAA